MNDEIKTAVNTLSSGGVILFPADIGWFYGCDATSQPAINKLLSIYDTPLDSEPITILSDDSGKLQSYLNDVPEMAWDLIEFSEKPLTIIFSSIRNLAKELTGEKKLIGIRISKELFSKSLCKVFRNPIAIVSASGNKNNGNIVFSEIPNDIKNKIDYIVKYDPKTFAKDLAIISLGKGNTIKIIR